MIDPAKLEELIARVEAATGADRELDYALHDFEHGKMMRESGYVRRNDGSFYSSTPPVKGAEHIAAPQYYTASIDAALALCERLRPGWGYQVGRPLQTYVSGWYASVFEEGHYFHDWTRVKDEIRPRGSYRPNGPLAILLALLKSLEPRP